MRQSWKQSDGLVGRAVLRVVVANEIVGTWGFNDSHTDGRPTNEWRLIRSKQ